MASYVVMESPDHAAEDGSPEFIRDGFSWLAFFVPPLWLLWHRLWVEALLATIVAFGAIGAMPWQGMAGSLLALVVPLYVGLEGQAMRVAALGRRGWRQWGVVEAGTLDDAVTRYALASETEQPEAVATPRIVPDAALARPAQTGMALGLTHSPGRP